MVGALKSPENLGALAQPLPEKLILVILGVAGAATTAETAVVRRARLERRPIVLVIGKTARYGVCSDESSAVELEIGSRLFQGGANAAFQGRCEDWRGVYYDGLCFDSRAVQERSFISLAG